MTAELGAWGGEVSGQWRRWGGSFSQTNNCDTRRKVQDCSALKKQGMLENKGEVEKMPTAAVGTMGHRLRLEHSLRTGWRSGLSWLKVQHPLTHNDKEKSGKKKVRLCNWKIPQMYLLLELYGLIFLASSSDGVSSDTFTSGTAAGNKKDTVKKGGAAVL